MMKRPPKLNTKTMMVSTTAAAYALFCTSSCGALNWKNTLNGNVAACWFNPCGIWSENPAVNITPAQSPMALPILNKVAVAMAGAICLNTTPMVSILVAPKLYDQSRISCGIVFATSSIDRINIGTMSRVVTRIPPPKDALMPNHTINVKAKDP